MPEKKGRSSGLENGKVCVNKGEKMPKLIICCLLIVQSHHDLLRPNLALLGSTLFLWFSIEQRAASMLEGRHSAAT